MQISDRQPGFHLDIGKIKRDFQQNYKSFG